MTFRNIIIIDDDTGMARGDERLVVEMMKLGACDYLVKDKTFLDLLPAVVEKAFLQLEQKKRLEQTERALRKSKEELEKRVRQRTSELSRSNKRLQTEIADRHRAEQQLRAYQMELRSLASQLTLTEQRERQRLAADLHDTIGQNLAFMQMQMETLREKTATIREKKKGQQITDSLDEIHKLIQESIIKTHSLVFELSPPVLHELGFEAAVEWLLEKIQEEHNVKCRLEAQNSGSTRLDPDVRIVLFRAVRELMINIAKHARAHTAKVSIFANHELMSITVADDGVGFDLNQVRSQTNTSTGFGLFNIRERLEHLGGNVDILSQPDQGTTVTMKISLDHCRS